ncbi:MAG: tetratricopeptide repeat protein [Coprococcus sp.]
MSVDERENREKKNRKIKSSSDRNRIKNITNKVHPEYAASKKSRDGRSSDSEQMLYGKGRASQPLSSKHEQSQEEIRRRRKRAERMKKIRRRRRRQQILRILAFCLVMAALVMTVLVVKNYNSGSRHDNKGMNAYENGDYDTAVREFKEALSYDGQNADYYIHLGMAYIEQKSYDQALGYFNQAEGSAENDDQRALLNRGRGIACLYQGDYESAISWFKNALEAVGQSKEIRIDTLYYKAETEEKSGNYTSAVQSYGQIIDLQDDAGARMLRGMAYMALEDYASAETDLYAAISQSRKSYSIYRALYSALEAQGKDDEAREVLNDALGLSGSSGEDYFNRGMIYLDLQDDDSAIEMLEKSYEKGYTAALLGLGETAVRQKDYDKARSYYETFFNEVDQNKVESSVMAHGYNQYAVCLMDSGNYEEAAAACENGLKYNAREMDAALSFNLISAYEHLARWEDAYNVARDYVSKYPDDEKGMKEYQFLESRVIQ